MLKLLPCLRTHVTMTQHAASRAWPCQFWRAPAFCTCSSYPFVVFYTVTPLSTHTPSYVCIVALSMLWLPLLSSGLKCCLCAGRSIWLWLPVSISFCPSSLPRHRIVLPSVSNSQPVSLPLLLSVASTNNIPDNAHPLPRRETAVAYSACFMVLSL